MFLTQDTTSPSLRISSGLKADIAAISVNPSFDEFIDFLNVK